MYHISRLHSWVRLLRLRIAVGAKQREGGGDHEKGRRAQDSEGYADCVTLLNRTNALHPLDRAYYIVCSRSPSRVGSQPILFEKRS